MKIKNHKISRKKSWLLALGVLLVVVFGASGYLLLKKYNGSPTVKNQDYTIDYSNPTSEQKKGEQTAEQTPPSDSSNTNSGSSGASSTNTSIRITAAAQTREVLRIRTIIEPLVSGGICTLSLTKSGQPAVEKSVSTQAASSYTTCQGFDIDTSSMTAGTWSATVTYINGNITATTNQNVEVY